jgi:hypothetical protein
MTLTNRVLRQALANELKSERAYFKDRRKKKRAAVLELQEIAQKLEDAHLAYFASTCAVFVKIPYSADKTKATFAHYVALAAKALDCPPDIEIDQNAYRATFLGGKVWCSIYQPEDCQLIDVEVTTVVKKPHPSCVAALSSLENIA